MRYFAVLKPKYILEVSHEILQVCREILITAKYRKKVSREILITAKYRKKISREILEVCREMVGEGKICNSKIFMPPYNSYTFKQLVFFYN